MSPNPSHPAVAMPYERVEGIHVRWYDSWIEVVLLVIVATGDFISFWIALQLLNAYMPAWAAMLLVGALTAAAVLLMHMAGGRARDIKARESAHGKFPVFCLVIFWLGLGVFAFVARLKAGEPTGGSDIFAGSGATTDTNTNLIMASLMLALFLAGGVGAYIIGFTQHNPKRRLEIRRYRMYKRLTRKLAKVNARIDKQSKAVNRLNGEITSATAELESSAGELRQIARLRLAEHIREPGATSGLLA